MCRADGANHAALLALLGEELVGVASYEPTGAPDTAEIAFAVADQMHGRGVATLLLEHLVSLARAAERAGLHRRRPCRRTPPCSGCSRTPG